MSAMALWSGAHVACASFLLPSTHFSNRTFIQHSSIYTDIIKYNDDRSHTDRSPRDDIYTRRSIGRGQSLLYIVHQNRSQSKPIVLRMCLWLPCRREERKRDTAMLTGTTTSTTAHTQKKNY